MALLVYETLYASLNKWHISHCTQSLDGPHDEIEIKPLIPKRPITTPPDIKSWWES